MTSNLLWFFERPPNVYTHACTHAHRSGNFNYSLLLTNVFWVNDWIKDHLYHQVSIELLRGFICCLLSIHLTEQCKALLKQTKTPCGILGWVEGVSLLQANYPDLAKAALNGSEDTALIWFRRLWLGLRLFLLVIFRPEISQLKISSNKWRLNECVMWGLFSLFSLKLSN